MTDSRVEDPIKPIGVSVSQRLTAHQEARTDCFGEETPFSTSKRGVKLSVSKPSAFAKNETFENQKRCSNCSVIGESPPVTAGDSDKKDPVEARPL